MEQTMRCLKLGSAGMRGIVGYGLAPENAINFAAAFGTFLNGGKILVATDSRVSSPMLKNAALSALCSCGCEVIDAGVMPAGVIHYLIPALQFSGGLLIGGGHQSSGWNSIIPLGADGAYFNAMRQRELLDIYHSKRFAFVAWDRLGKVSALPKEALDCYFDALCNVIDVDAIRKAKLTVIVDLGNGSGSVLHHEFAERLGIHSIAINDSPSGFLPRDPEPRPRAGSPLRSIIAPLSASIGAVFNSDMSRLELVTDCGEPLSEELTYPIGAAYLLKKHGDSAKVVGNICSTGTLERVVEKNNSLLEKTKVGQAAVIDVLKETNAYLAGEGSGAFTTSDWVKGFDAIYCLAVILEAIAVSGRSICSLVADLPRYHIIKRSIDCPLIHAYAMIRQAKTLFPDAALSEIDGLRFDWPDGWLSVRLSSTDQVIRLISEAAQEEIARDRAGLMRTFLERQMNL